MEVGALALQLQSDAWAGIVSLAMGPMINRRTVLAAPLLSGSARVMSATASAARTDWDSFRSRFIAADGRVIDTGNAGVSHSEGQGWGLLFAEYFDDHSTFQRILRWTHTSLQ